MGRRFRPAMPTARVEVASEGAVGRGSLPRLVMNASNVSSAERTSGRHFARGSPFCDAESKVARRLNSPAAGESNASGMGSGDRDVRVDRLWACGARERLRSDLGFGVDARRARSRAASPRRTCDRDPHPRRFGGRGRVANDCHRRPARDRLRALDSRRRRRRPSLRGDRPLRRRRRPSHADLDRPPLLEPRSGPERTIRRPTRERRSRSPARGLLPCRRRAAALPGSR